MEYYKNKPVLTDASPIIDFPAANNKSVLYKFEQKITGETDNEMMK